MVKRQPGATGQVDHEPHDTPVKDLPASRRHRLCRMPSDLRLVVTCRSLAETAESTGLRRVYCIQGSLARHAVGRAWQRGFPRISDRRWLSEVSESCSDRGYGLVLVPLRHSSSRSPFPFICAGVPSHPAVPGRTTIVYVRGQARRLAGRLWGGELARYRHLQHESESRRHDSSDPDGADARL
jgi:hypothetical protein